VQLGEHVLEVEHSVATTRGAAVANESNWLGGPLREVPVDRGLERGW
jgi:hypothetical protein